MPQDRRVYAELPFRFSVGSMEFEVLNLAYERFERVLPSHSHGSLSYEIHYIASGQGSITLDNCPYLITPNTLYLTGPLIEHSQTPDPDDPMVEYCVYLKLCGIESGSPRDRLSQIFLETHCWFGHDRQRLDGIFSQLFDELKQRRTGYLEQIQALLQQLIIHMVRNYEAHTNASPLHKPLHLGERNDLTLEECFLYEYPDLTLQKLASRLGLSIRQTERVLMKQYGKTFQQKKAEAQMSAAAIFLRDRSLRIAVIAERLGYSSTEHFSAAFKRYYAMSASAYRKQLFYVECV